MIAAMAFPDDTKAWAKAQTERLRSDPKGWAQDQADRLKKMVDVAPFSPEALEKELAALRVAVARVDTLADDERVALHDAIIQLRERLGTGGAAASGAKIGLAASVLPVVGLITGPLIGGAYGAYRSAQLGDVRKEVDEMLHTVVRSKKR